MKEIPILFSTPMVKALLAGTKTQTRRIVKPQPIVDEESGYTYFGKHQFDIHSEWVQDLLAISKWQAGDVLWVRETWGMQRNDMSLGDIFYVYKADDETYLPKWKPSLFMPRSACRIFLAIESVRVERLRDISEADAIAEGIESPLPGWWRDYVPGNKKLAQSDPYYGMYISPIDSYRSLWESINGSGSWELNPWVFVIRFKRIEKSTL